MTLDQKEESTEYEEVAVIMETPIRQVVAVTEKPAWVTDTKYNLLTNGIYNGNPSANPKQCMNEHLLRQWKIKRESLNGI